MKRTHWVFGYGSLVWRPGFPYQRRTIAYIQGFARRFWQGSTDHRGTEQMPGRVVTLVPTPGARCDGVAYAIAEADRERVMGALDHREKGGYVRSEIPIFFPDRSSEPGVVYFAGPDNPNYLGPAPIEAIADEILARRGPSGPNLEYALRLAEALRSQGANDPHVFELEAALRARLDRG